jgi:hypothetical protein
VKSPHQPAERAVTRRARDPGLADVLGDQDRLPVVGRERLHGRTAFGGVADAFQKAEDLEVAGRRLGGPVGRKHACDPGRPVVTMDADHAGIELLDVRHRDPVGVAEVLWQPLDSAPVI